MSKKDSRATVFLIDTNNKRFCELLLLDYIGLSAKKLAKAVKKSNDVALGCYYEVVKVDDRCDYLNQFICDGYELYYPGPR